MNANRVLKSSSQRRLLSLAVVLGLAVMIAGCNTIAGFGRDLQATGEAITDSAE